VNDDPTSRIAPRSAQRRLAEQIIDPDPSGTTRKLVDKSEIAHLGGESLDNGGDEPARTMDRVTLSAEVRLRRSGEQGYKVSVFDLSAEGCKIEFIVRPAIGATVWVKFEGLQAVEATVRWIEGYVGGLQFERQLHPAIFQRLTRRSRVSSA
jgi:hypothetical protein